MILMVQSPPIGSVSTVPSSQRRKSEIDSLNVARASSSFHRRPCASHCPPIYAGFLRNISTLSARGEDSVFGRDADCSGALIADQVGDVVCRGLEKERRLTLPNNSALCRLAAPSLMRPPPYCRAGGSSPCGRDLLRLVPARACCTPGELRGTVDGSGNLRAERSSSVGDRQCS